MATWSLVPSLVSLRNEFNELSPTRDKASDGSIGDTAHAASKSDHNPAPDGQVHAIDVDVDLRLPGWSMGKAVEVIVLRHRSGRDDRLQNVIYNRRIWSRSWGWTARAYTGPNPHDHHAHFGARYTTAQENDTRPWGLLELLEDEMALSEAQTKAAAKAGASEALLELLADGYRAATGKASGTTDADKRARNVRDFLRGIVGGPTEDEIASAKAEVLTAVTNIVIARPDGGTVSQAEVEAGVEAAFRNAFTKN
jgi:hypothetical protein